MASPAGTLPKNHSGAQSRAEGQHRAHGQVNGVRQYDKGLAEGNESVNGRLAQQGQEIGPGAELGLAMLMPATSRIRAMSAPKILGVIDDFILIFIHDKVPPVANVIIFSWSASSWPMIPLTKPSRTTIIRSLIPSTSGSSEDTMMMATPFCQLVL